MSEDMPTNNQEEQLIERNEVVKAFAERDSAAMGRLKQLLSQWEQGSHPALRDRYGFERGRAELYEQIAQTQQDLPARFDWYLGAFEALQAAREMVFNELENDPDQGMRVGVERELDRVGQILKSLNDELRDSEQ